MKVTYSVILSLALLGLASALPASTEPKLSRVIAPDEPTTLEDIDRETGYGDQPVVDTGLFDGSISSPFDGFLQNFENMLNRMRQQMEYLFNRFGGNGTVSSDEAFNIGLPLPPDFDPSKANTTSVVKTINGHKVVINETEYKDEGADGGAYYKIRIFDVQPNDSEVPTNTDAGISSDRESVENSGENEIPKNKEIEGVKNRQKSADQVDSRRLQNRLSPYDNVWENVEPLDYIESNDLEYPSEPMYPSEPIDLSRDIYVNKLLADAGAPTNPDAEIIDVEEFSKEKERRPRISEKLTG